MEIQEMVTDNRKPTTLKMSYEEFLTWADEDIHAEWINNEVIIQMPPKLVHQVIVGFLHELLILHARLFDLGQVCMAPFEVKLMKEGASREPDLFFVTKENLNRLTEDRLEGAPDLVIEIVSKSSVKNDRSDKFHEYSEAGVREYWIIDPRPGKQRADFYRLNEKGVYQLYATEDDEKVSSGVLSGFWLRPQWLWKANLLNPLTCSFEIEGVLEAVAEQMKQVQNDKQSFGR